MPITISAKKALRRDRRRAMRNNPLRSRMRTALINARKVATVKSVSAAYSAIDRAAKKRVIHPNKAARLKSRLEHLVKGKKKSS